GGVRRFDDLEEFHAAARNIQAAFEAGDFPEVIRLIDRNFGQSRSREDAGAPSTGSNYSLKSLFKDEQRRILDQIMASTHDDLENRFRLITERYTPLMKFLA